MCWSCSKNKQHQGNEWPLLAWHLKEKFNTLVASNYRRKMNFDCLEVGQWVKSQTQIAPKLDILSVNTFFLKLVRGQNKTKNPVNLTVKPCSKHWFSSSYLWGLTHCFHQNCFKGCPNLMSIRYWCCVISSASWALKWGITSYIVQFSAGLDINVKMLNLLCPSVKAITYEVKQY